MAFQSFERSRASTSEPMISITKYGQININQQCYEEYIKSKKSENVELFYDPERKIIGIRPVLQKTSNSYPIRINRTGNFAQISGIAFLKFFDITHTKTKSYKANWNSKEKLVEVDLKT